MMHLNRLPNFFKIEVSKEKTPEKGMVFTDDNLSKRILKELFNFQSQGLFCDVTLSVDGREFLVHKNVLASFSPYFRAIFTTTVSESKQDVITIQGIEGATMELLLQYAYTGNLQINLSNVKSLLSAANLLQFEHVKGGASLVLEEHINLSNCFETYFFAEAHSCLPLIEKTKEYILKNIMKIYPNDEFLNLSQEKIIEFISDDKLNVKNEEDAFDIIVKWCEHDPERRIVNIHKLLEHVRLPLMSPYFLCDYVETFPYIQCNPECRALIEEAKKFHLLPDRRPQTQKSRHRFYNDKLQVIVIAGDDRFDCYDPSTKVWKSLPSFPYRLSKRALVSSGENVLYLAGGEYSKQFSPEVFRYDAVGWQEIARMIVARSELGLAVLDGWVYAIGGWEGKNRLKSVEKYNPRDNTWQMVCPMAVALSSPACVSLNGALYVTGGAILEGDTTELVQKYNPVTDSWVEMAPMLISRCGAAACVFKGEIYVMGGRHGSAKNTNKVERYNVEKNKWEFVASMQRGRHGPGAAVIGEKIYVFGGEEIPGRSQTSFEYFDAEKNVWVIEGQMDSRSWLGCASIKIKKSIFTKAPSLEFIKEVN